MRRPRPVRAVRRILAAAARSALAAAAFVACGGGDDAKAPVDVYASQYGNATCSVWDGCCRENGLSFDRNQCGLYAAIYIQGDVDRRLAAGATFDQAAAEKCIRAAVDATKACTLNEDFEAARTACRRVWSGPKKVGESCASDMECESSGEGSGACVGKSQNVDGTCAIKTPSASLGDVCGTVANGEPPKTVADCEGNGMQCNLLSQTCSPFVPLGGNCGAFNPCEKDLFCDDSGACVAALDAGATCSENAPKQCKSRVCIHGKCGANPVGTLTPCTGEMP